MTSPAKTRKRENPTLDEIQTRMAAGVKTGFIQGSVTLVYFLRHIGIVQYAPKNPLRGATRFRIYGFVPGGGNHLKDSGLECEDLHEALVTAIAFDSCKDPLVYADAALRVLGLRGGPLPQGT